MRRMTQSMLLGHQTSQHLARALDFGVPTMPHKVPIVSYIDLTTLVSFADMSTLSDIAMNPVQAPPNATLANPFPINLGLALNPVVNAMFCHFELAIVDSSHPYGRFDNSGDGNSGNFNIFNDQEKEHFTWALTTTPLPTSLLTTASRATSIASSTSSNALSPTTSRTSAVTAPNSITPTISGYRTSLTTITSTGPVYTTTSPSTSSINNPKAPHNAWLTASAKAGITVGATLGATTGLIVLLYWYIRVRRSKVIARKRAPYSSPRRTPQISTELAGDWEPSELTSVGRPLELEGVSRSELAGTGFP